MVSAPLQWSDSACRRTRRRTRLRLELIQTGVMVWWGR